MPFVPAPALEQILKRLERSDRALGLGDTIREQVENKERRALIEGALLETLFERLIGRVPAGQEVMSDELAPLLEIFDHFATRHERLQLLHSVIGRLKSPTR